jgi:hypothetical protein
MFVFGVCSTLVPLHKQHGTLAARRRVQSRGGRELFELGWEPFLMGAVGEWWGPQHNIHFFFIDGSGFGLGVEEENTLN